MQAPRTVVIVSHICPFPVVHGNRSRLVSLIRWLRSQGIHVTYVLQPLDVDQASGVAELERAVDRLEVIPSPSDAGRMASATSRAVGYVARKLLARRLRERLRGFVARMRGSREPLIERWGTGDVGGDGHIDRWCWPETATAVRRLVRKLQPVAVITEYALLSKCLQEVPAPTLKIIDTVEVFFRNRERFDIEGLTAPFVCTPDSERVALERADVLIGIQRNEAETLKTLFPGKRVITVGHTYSHGGERPRQPSTGVVLYVGSSNPFNVHGMREFLLRAWPLIRGRMPAARLRIVGSCPYIEGVDARGVEYVGRVSDQALRHEYETAHVVINPQLAGTGLKIKCVEALTAGCPMVMNRAGADGLEEGAGRAFLVAEDWEDFVQHVLRILTDDRLRQRVEQEASRLADRLFSPEATFSELASALREPTRELAARP